MSILGLIAAFGGGVFAAAIGGVPAFIMTGVFSIVGAAAYAKKKGVSENGADIVSALAFADDFPPVAPEFHQRTHRVRLRNLGTTDKKSSRKIKYKKIPRVHFAEIHRNL